ncbi:collectin-12-like [Sardina pilchardus]|uniref:collectin-12-like n=1 Tax=Sardina pilchardus TaxID=27697 RepID=UPI002E1042B4
MNPPILTGLMDSKPNRRSKKKKEPSGGVLSSAHPKPNKVTPVETKNKNYVPSSRTNKKILPPVKHTVPRSLPPMRNSVRSQSRPFSKDAGEKFPLVLYGRAALHQLVKPPSYDEPISEVARECLSPHLIRNFPAESFAFLEQLSQMQRITVTKILKMKYITNLELLQKSKMITNWVTVASRDVVLPAVYLYQAITKDLYKKYTQKDLHHKWLCLGDGGMSSAVNHEGVVSAAHMFNALVCMTRTTRKQPEDSDESCLAYSGQSTPSSSSVASHRKGNLLYCSQIHVNASELVQHMYRMLLNSHLGSIYISQSWWAMMTPDLAAKRNLEFLSDLLFNFIVYAVKNLLESFLGLPHKVPCSSSMEWTLKSRPGVSSTVVSEEAAALEALSEVLISRVADVLSTISETQHRATDLTCEDSAEADQEEPIVYDDHLEEFLSSLQLSGTLAASRSPCTSEGLDSVTTLSTQSLETVSDLLMLCKNENGPVYQHPTNPVAEGRDCDKRSHNVVSEQTSLSGFCLDQNSASGNSAQSTSSCTSMCGPPGCTSMCGPPGCTSMCGPPGCTSMCGPPGCTSMCGPPGCTSMCGPPGCTSMCGPPGCSSMCGPPGCTSMCGPPGCTSMCGAPGCSSMCGPPGCTSMCGPPGCTSMCGPPGCTSMCGPPGCTSMCGPPGCTTAERHLSSAETVELIEGSDDGHPLKESSQATSEQSSPTGPSMCWASDELPGRACSSSDPSPSTSTTTSHKSQPSPSSHTHAVDATVVEDTQSMGCQNNISIKQLSSDHSLRAHQQEPSEPLKDSADMQEKRQTCLFKGTKIKTCPEGLMDLSTNNRRFHRSKAVSRLFCFDCREESYEDVQ